MIRLINEIISCFYFRDSEGMKFSSPQMVLFIAKCKLAIPIFIWGLAIISFFERYILKFNFFTQYPNGRLFATVIVLLIYYPINKITWKLDEVKRFTSDSENLSIIRRRLIHYFIIIGIGAFLLIFIGYQNKWHPLP